ncbi:MAG TPA: glycosyl hydrolase, partial [Saprospiraceae bacterium]|nr:glycosyl hydrolase [Saprospiraceae bacterium]
MKVKNFLIVVITLFFSDLSAQNDVSKPYGMLSYRNIGPYRGGRSCAVVGIDRSPKTFYFGATGGGVWKTEDGGASWKNVSDGYFGGSIGAITVAPSDPNVLYVGGGEKTVRGNVSYGYGVWKTEDAGKTWVECGLKNSRHVGRIKVHPTNPDIVYVAVMGDLFKPTQERGVFKSIDGGKTWKKVLFANDQAGAVDLTIDPSNHRILYASTWRIKRSPFDLSSGGEGSALWKSTDSGETWTNISTNEGLPKGDWGIVGVTVAPKNSNRIWAIIENENGGVYRSDNGGKSWVKLNEDRSLRQRAWYYTRIYADTQDDDVVYVLNVSYHKSTDGGRTFTASNAPHGDHGGGASWSSYHYQPTAQFYRVVTDDPFPFRIYVAQQDNSTLRINHRSFGNSISEEDWEETAGGESGHIAVDPLNNDIVYGGSYDGFLTRVNHKNKSFRAVNVWPDNPMGHGAEGMKYRFQWNFPIFFSKHNPKKLYTTS